MSALGIGGTGRAEGSKLTRAMCEAFWLGLKREMLHGHAEVVASRRLSARCRRRVFT